MNYRLVYKYSITLDDLHCKTYLRLDCTASYIMFVNLQADILLDHLQQLINN